MVSEGKSLDELIREELDKGAFISDLMVVTSGDPGTSFMIEGLRFNYSRYVPNGKTYLFNMSEWGIKYAGVPVQPGAWYANS